LKNTLKTLMSATVVLAALSLTACSSSGSTGAGGGSAGGGTGGGGGGTGGSGGGTAAATCTGYCTTIQTNCAASTDGGVSVGQYPSADSCNGVCAAFAQGDAGATAGNSKECRNYHAVASPADKTLHCPHAGPAGDGVCGASNCESFCIIAQSVCTGAANSQFADNAACLTACNAFPSATAHYNSSSISGNTFACRMYHLSVAASSAANATTHCPHIKTASTPCM
jgi:hypothetical protein